jgi:hypothetical protein
MEKTEKRETEYDEELYRKFFDLVGSPDDGAGSTGTGSRKISQSQAARALDYSSGVVVGLGSVPK